MENNIKRDIPFLAYAYSLHTENFPLPHVFGPTNRWNGSGLLGHPALSNGKFDCVFLTSIVLFAVTFISFYCIVYTQNLDIIYLM